MSAGRSAYMPWKGAYRKARTRQTAPATPMMTSRTLRKVSCGMRLATGKASSVPRMTPGAPYRA